MSDACVRSFGTQALSALVGLAANDWRCVRRADVDGHIVPILLFPRHSMFDLNEAAFVTLSLRRIGSLMDGVRRFYREQTSHRLRATGPFLVLTQTSATGWENLALCTDRDACRTINETEKLDPPAPYDRFGYTYRVSLELANSGWARFKDNGSSIIIGGFVSLGSAPRRSPTWCGSADLFQGQTFVVAPSNSYVTCDDTTKNSPEYENAFYGAAHELGHAFGLRHSNDPRYCPDPKSYNFNDTDSASELRRPADLAHSIMCLGAGTSSQLFSFEAERALQFLMNWQ